MDDISKPWDWKNNSEDLWFQSSEESYYLSHRWKKNGYKDFLDFGCGLGRHAIFFAQEGFNVSAFDLSQEGVDTLKRWSVKESLHIDLKVADMLSLPYKENSFDCLLAYHVVAHTSSEGIKQIISEIKRVLKDNGEFYLTLGSKDSWSFRESGYPKIDENTVRKVGGNEDGIPHLFVNLDDILELFKDFEIKTIQHRDDCFFDGNRQSFKHYFLLGKNSGEKHF